MRDHNHMNNRSIQLRFTACYEAEVDSIFRFCSFRVSDHEQAIDLVQETFTRMWRVLSDGTRIENDRAFLFTVAHHVIIDWYRKKKALSLESLADPESQESYEPSDGRCFADLERDAEGRRIVAKLNDVSPINGQAVYLRFIEGMSPPDIGKVLGITGNAAAVRVNRGLKELRHLTGYDQGAQTRANGKVRTDTTAHKLRKLVTIWRKRDLTTRMA